jgi:hypothetical protein
MENKYSNDNIDWDELRIKVEEDYDKELLDLINTNEDCSTCSADCKICEGRQPRDCIGLPTKDGSDSYDFNDEHGLIDEFGNEIEDELLGGEDIDTEDETIDDEPTKEEISSIAWNKAKSEPMSDEEIKQIEDDLLRLEEPGMHPELDKETNDIECKHFENESQGIGEVYIYPINESQRVCLCRICNASLASKMLEQLALETFISRY